MRGQTRNIIISLVIFVAVLVLFSLFNAPLSQTKEIDLGTLVTQIDNEQVKAITVRNDQLEVTLNNDEKQTVRKETSESLTTLLNNYEVAPEKIRKVAIDVKTDSSWKFWAVTVLPFALPLLLIVGFFYFMMRQAQGANNKAMSFGSSGAKEFNPNLKTRVTFKDVAGVKEAKQELEEVVDFLKNPKKFLALGATIPKGVLLLGAPGTGKTLLAKAVAGEANVPFFSISGSEFVEMFVGVGASRVRDLFRKAKKNSPCIIFIDEIDAVGRQRGSGMGGSHDEREQTLNQILVEMDGFEPTTNIIIMAATNRPDVLDTALLRPGRFDRQVTLDLPDINDREGILKVHAAKKPLAADINLRKIGERTPGFSGAELANLLNEAAILAARRDQKEIKITDVLESIDKIMIGPERKSHILNDREKKITAYHEAGHALVAHELPNTDPVRKVSIIARGMAAGFTLKLPTEDKKLHNRSEFIEELAVMLAGRITEQEIFGEITTGASNDLRQVTKLAKKIIMVYGMSDELGLRTFGTRDEMMFLGRGGQEQSDYSEKTSELIDIEIKRLSDEAAATAKRIITEKRDMLDKIANELMVKETIEHEEFEALFTGKKVEEKTETVA
ncbi:MAG: ATP-dependent zinc metalloprotease FtsH [Candidatus Buchananbacteria bacterium]|nr:ATP-dependent zinc metalloprotease FtsH [Candidatus Buchananbacteria bacterium]